MREKSRLERGIGGYRKIENELHDALGLIEMARGRGRPDHSDRGRGQSRQAARRGGEARTRKPACRARPTATTPILRSIPAPAAPRRRIGPRCCCACMRAGPRRTTTRWNGSKKARARAPASNPRPSASSVRTPMAGSRPKAACIAWCGFRRSTPTPGARPASPRSGSIPWSTTRSRSSSRTSISAPTPIARRAPAASMSTRPTAPFA